MSRKMNFIPYIPNYEWVRNQMNEDLKYRLSTRTTKTSFGRPLYHRINVQIVTTHECPYHCPFCMERQNPMSGENDFDAQKESLKRVLAEHSDARLTITGGEPSLYLDHVRNLLKIYNENSNRIFSCVNSTGYNFYIANVAHELGAKLNLSRNDYIPKFRLSRSCIQTVMRDSDMNIDNIKKYIDQNSETEYSFRFLSSTGKQDYNIEVFNELQSDKDDIKISTFRVGDFFMYATFNYKGKHARITLGDMYQQKHNNYLDGYSNIIIHPDGVIGVNWS